jgi:hypothetical protein
MKIDQSKHFATQAATIAAELIVETATFTPDASGGGELVIHVERTAGSIAFVIDARGCIRGVSMT